MAKTNEKNGKKVPLSVLKKTRPNDSLQQIVDDYLLTDRSCWDDLNLYINIVDCVCGRIGNKFKAADGTEYYKRCRHQAHMLDSTIENVTEALEILKPELEKLKDFEELLKNVEKVKIWGFGPLSKYDFSVRFGFRHGLKPEKYVYLHAGTRDGADELKRLYPNLNKPEFEDKIPVKEFPKELKRLMQKELAGYGTIHVENFLCIFKDRLATLK